MRSLLFASTLALTGVATAQVPGHQGNIGGGIGLSIPTGEFQGTWGRNMFDINAHLAFPLGILPFQGGFAFDHGRMGGSRDIVPVNDAALTATEGELRVRAKVLSYHPLLRFSPLKGKVRPYVDAMAGFRQFSTVSTIHVDGLESTYSTERNSNDLAFSTGWAAGVMITWGGVAYVEARVERFNSGEATYVDPASISVDDQGTVGFNTLTSKTNAVNVLLGIGLRF